MAAQENEFTLLLQETSKMIANAKAVGLDERQVAELYGIYYNAFAGILRAGGILYSKKMDVDGYPKLVITIGDTQYTCRDAALRDILRDDYEKLTSFPYSDTSTSYVQPYAGNGGKRDDKDESEYGMYGTRSTTTTASLEDIRKTERIIKAEEQKEKNLLREKARLLDEKAKQFKYDPNYDHYYDDRLGEILQELDASSAKVAAGIAAILIPCAMIVVALTLL